jgi:uncharacterized protein
MPPVVTDNPDRNRFEIHVEGARAGFAEYRLAEDRITFTHTEVDDAYSGQGLGKALATSVLDSARDAGLEVIPLCPFIAGYIKRNREYVDLVPAAYRERFGLEPAVGG